MAYVLIKSWHFSDKIHIKIKNFSSESWSLDQDLNRASSEHKTDSSATMLIPIKTLLNANYHSYQNITYFAPFHYELRNYILGQFQLCY
jgi:hypothetical protein